jgi:deoxyribodipyrimidine photo-lyase
MRPAAEHPPASAAFGPSGADPSAPSGAPSGSVAADTGFGAGSTSIVWFRDDLRLADNPALTAAVERGGPVLPLYVLDDESPGIRPPGGAARWWLNESLRNLAEALAERGTPLILRHGPAGDVIRDLLRESGAGAVFWNRRYGQAARDVDAAIKTAGTADGIEVHSFGAALLFEPWTVTTSSGDPFQVFTPFWRHCLQLGEPRAPLPVPPLAPAHPSPIATDRLDDLDLLPRHPDWAGGLRDANEPGEAAALRRLGEFVRDGLAAYPDQRNDPAARGTSRLSPHLRWGEVSPFQVWHAVMTEARGDAGNETLQKATTAFLSEIGWREFCYHQLFSSPDIARRNLNARFDAFEWKAADPGILRAWQFGRTGFPLVDAGMRALWRDGTLHNRVRMVVASFLIKNLRIDWREGEAWFWDTLVDADEANNAANWQWVAGSGADAAPFFRVFNPVLQSHKFDAEGDYIREYVPELAHVPAEHVHEPWTLSQDLVARAEGEDDGGYPAPIVDLAVSRREALAAYERTATG